MRAPWRVPSENIFRQNLCPDIQDVTSNPVIESDRIILAPNRTRSFTVIIALNFSSYLSFTVPFSIAIFNQPTYHLTVYLHIFLRRNHSEYALKVGEISVHYLGLENGITQFHPFYIAEYYYLKILYHFFLLCSKTYL